MRSKFRSLLKVVLILGVAGIALALVINIDVRVKGRDICASDAHAQAALVLGALVWSDGQMSGIFQDRVDTAIDLYHGGKVEKILVSGDHGRKDYDEVNAAKQYLLEHGIPPEDIFLDHAGFDTYDSLYRARDVFEAQSLILVTQKFHLPRALYLAHGLGVPSCGVAADLHAYPGGATKRSLREIPADVKAWLDVTFHAKPTFLGDAIPLSGDGRNTWD